MQCPNMAEAGSGSRPQKKTLSFKAALEALRPVAAIVHSTVGTFLFGWGQEKAGGSFPLWRGVGRSESQLRDAGPAQMPADREREQEEGMGRSQASEHRLGDGRQTLTGRAGLTPESRLLPPGEHFNEAHSCNITERALTMLIT